MAPTRIVGIVCLTSDNEERGREGDPQCPRQRSAVRQHASGRRRACPDRGRARSSSWSKANRPPFPHPPSSRPPTTASRPRPSSTPRRTNSQGRRRLAQGSCPRRGSAIFFGGVSAMWLERRLADDPLFPRPRYIAGKRYWEVEELAAWVEAQPREAPDWVTEAGTRGKAAARASMAQRAAQKQEQVAPPPSLPSPTRQAAQCRPRKPCPEDQTSQAG